MIRPPVKKIAGFGFNNMASQTMVICFAGFKGAYHHLLYLSV